MEDLFSFMFESVSFFYCYYNWDMWIIYLVEEVFGSCYFVIVFVYDGVVIVKGEWCLFWWMKMIVNLSGVSMVDILFILIYVVVLYFGECMEKVIIVIKCVV